MSSNEEYLDSLLKAVTAKEQAGNGGANNELDKETGSGKNIENKSTDGVSPIDLEQMLAREESYEDVTKMKDEFAGGIDPDVEEERAFSDPGALFFAGEEEDDSFEDSFLAIEDISEDGEDIIAAVDSMEEDITAVADSMEKDVIATADSMEEDVIAVADSMEEDVIATADSMEEDVIAVADSMEEDVIAVADGVEEDIIAAADDTEEDVITAVDGMEEDVITAADGMEEDIIATADSMEEDVIAVADNGEEDSFAFEDEGFKEISDLLASSGDGDDDMFAMLESVESEGDSAGIDIGFFDEEENNNEPIKENKKERKKKERKEKNKRNKKNPETEEAAEIGEGTDELVSVGETVKKPGIFTRFVNFLMEEDDEEEDTGKVREPIDEDDELFITEEMSENEVILQELDKEDTEQKSGKADKKKKKKGKKSKNTEAESETDEDDLEEKEDKGKKKVKKEKKKKKEKVIKENIPEKPGKKLSIKKIEVTVVFCLTILAAILLAVNLVPGTLEKSRAREAYYAKDYEKVIEGFYNEKLSDSDTIMYNRAYTILRLQRKVDGYNTYMHMGKETEALNQLIEGVIRYKEIYPDAEKYNVTVEVDEIYQMITDALQNKYGISTTVAEGLYAMEDNLAYTLKLESIINGTEYVAPEYDGPEETEAETAEE